MSFGLLNTGFIPKRLPDIKGEIEMSLRSTFGLGINLLATSILGQIVGIFSEREALVWEVLEDIYNSSYPDTANGKSLHEVVRITGITPLDATKSEGEVTIYGTLGTVVPKGKLISVSGNSSAKFETKADVMIGTGTNEVQTVTFSSIPNSGSFKIVYNGDATTAIQHNDNAIVVETAINNLTALSGVAVSGSFAVGFVITYSGADGNKPHPLLIIIDNTLQNAGGPVNIAVVKTVSGEWPNVRAKVIALVAGAVSAYAGTLTVIETPVAGWSSVTNQNDVTVGKNAESDAELRFRRLETLAYPGVTTVDSIRAKLLQMDNVTAAKIFENDQDVVVNGRAPHSLEAVVLGGYDEPIAQKIWDVKPVGIQTLGTTIKQATDKEGFVHDVRFTRPIQVDIYVKLTITKTSDYPSTGDDAVKQTVVDFANKIFGISDDVILSRLYCPAHSVPGITSVVINIGTAPNPSGASNISIGETQIAKFDTTRIIIA